MIAVPVLMEILSTVFLHKKLINKTACDEKPDAT